MNTYTIRTFFGVILSILFICLPSLFAGLAPGTKIKTPTEMIYVENLEMGNTICGYGPTSHAFPNVEIEKIKSIHVESIYVITTKQGTICASADQLFYEITSQNFIPAEQLKPDHLLLTKNAQALECISVEHKNTSTIVYDLTLEEPHLFFSSDAQVLTHNAAPILLLAIPAAAPTVKFVASIGAIAAALYIEKIATSSLPIFAHCRKRRELKAQRRALLARLNQAEEHPTASNQSQTPPPPLIESTTPGSGQAPDPNDPKKKKDEEKEAAKKERIKIREDKAPHIFRKDRGHFEFDTPENRKILEDLANDETNYLGTDSYGKKNYAKILDNGKQLWAEVKGNSIRNAGINDVPKKFDLVTGLARNINNEVNLQGKFQR